MRPIALALAGLVAATLATPAHGATRKWKIAGTLSGEYSLNYSIDRGVCGSDPRSESARDVRVTLRSRRLVYDKSGRTIRSIRPLRVSVDAGQATYSGTETPRTGVGCGVPQPYSCTGQVTGEKGPRSKGRLGLLPVIQRGKQLARIGGSISFVVRGGPGGPPESPCQEMAQPFGTRGSFAPQVNDALFGVLRIPLSKLGGRRVFTVVAITEKDDPCDDEFKMACAEHSTLRLSLTFSPA